MSSYIRYSILLAAAFLVATVSEPGSAADKKRSPLPDNKTIDTFQYSFTPTVLGSAATLTIHKDGRVFYTYQSEPHTGSGGTIVVQKDWKLTECERDALLTGIVKDGLFDLEDTGGGKFPNHYVAVSYGRWLWSMHPKKLPEKLLKRILPFLQTAHPEEWGAAPDEK